MPDRLESFYENPRVANSLFNSIQKFYSSHFGHLCCYSKDVLIEVPQRQQQISTKKPEIKIKQSGNQYNTNANHGASTSRISIQKHATNDLNNLAQNPSKPSDHINDIIEPIFQDNEGNSLLLHIKNQIIRLSVGREQQAE